MNSLEALEQALVCVGDREALTVLRALRELIQTFADPTTAPWQGPPELLADPMMPHNVRAAGLAWGEVMWPHLEDFPDRYLECCRWTETHA